MKTAVAYLFLATVIIIFLAFSPLQSPRNQKNGSRRILRLHTVGNIHHVPFDPLVTKLIEGTSKDSDSYYDSNSMNPFNDVFEDPDEYFNEEGGFNVEARLKMLFPLLDRSPQDGKINLEELEAWNTQQATNHLIARTDREMKYHDKDEDGTITFQEYLPVFTPEDIEKNDMGHGQAGWWRERFVNADEDGNGNLNFKEFMDFLYPEDSTNEKIQLWSLKEKMRGMDHDNDGKLSYIEFRKQAYDNYKHTIQFETGRTDVPSPAEKFRELDVDKDRFLTEQELMPIVAYLHPGELTYAKHYTKHLIHQADDDKDGGLTLEEMLNHHQLFYNTVIIDEEEDSDDIFNDEL